MNGILEIVQPDFLLRDAFLGTLLTGIICPIVGVYFLLRKMIFLGIALPQVSAAGIAFSFCIFRLFVADIDHNALTEHALALGGSLLFTILALVVLALLASKKPEYAEGNIGVSYAFAAALTILFLAADPLGEAEMVSILKGDILAATAQSLLLQTIVFVSAVLLLFVFRRQLLLVSFDRDLAAIFGMKVKYWDLLLYAIIGATISIGVMTAGPVVVFGYLIIPPLTARPFSKNMTTFAVLSAAFGIICAFFGFYAAFSFDLPLGPTQIALASGLLIASACGRALFSQANFSGALGGLLRERLGDRGRSAHIP